MSLLSPAHVLPKGAMRDGGLQHHTGHTALSQHLLTYLLTYLLTLDICSLSALSQHVVAPTAHHSPLTTHHSPLTTHHSPLTTHHSPLTTHHSPLTTHHSPARRRERCHLCAAARTSSRRYKCCEGMQWSSPRPHGMTSRRAYRQGQSRDRIWQQPPTSAVQQAMAEEAVADEEVWLIGAMREGLRT